MVDWTRCRQVCQHPINERARSNRHVYARFLNILAQVVAPCATQCGALFDRLAMARERLSADGRDKLILPPHLLSPSRGPLHTDTSSIRPPLNRRGWLPEPGR